MTARELQQRLTSIERDLAELKSRGVGVFRQHPIHALEGIHSAFENDDAFQEAMRLGRKGRDNDRPNARATKAKRK